MYSAMFGNITPGATVKKTLQMKFSVAASLRTGWKSFASEMLPCTGPSILLWLAPAFRPPLSSATRGVETGHGCFTNSH